MFRKLEILLTTVMIMLGSTALAWQPNRPITVVVNHAPGSANEIVFRSLATEVEKSTGAKFTLVHKLGAGGVVGSKHLISQPADGYTIGMIMGESVSVQDKIHVPDRSVRNYGPADFSFVLAPAMTQFSVLAHVDDPINTPRELLEAIQNSRHTWSAGGGSRLVYETLKDRADRNNNMSWINSAGPVQAVLDVAGRHVRFAVVPSIIASQHIRDGKVKIVAFTGIPRIESLPNIGNINSVLPGFDIVVTFGIMAPASLPREIQDWYVREFTKAAQSESVRKFYSQNLIQVPSALMTPAGFTTYVQKLDREMQPFVDRVVAANAKNK